MSSENEATQGRWKNKIVGNALVPPQSLLTHELNFREHPKAQIAALAGAIEEIGYIRSVTVSKRTGKILDGHARVALAIAEGQEPVTARIRSRIERILSPTGDHPSGHADAFSA